MTTKLFEQALAKARLEPMLPIPPISVSAWWFKKGWSAAIALPVKKDQGVLIAAAEQFAKNYEGDERAGIKTDVLNAFYAGTKFVALPVQPAPESQ